MWWPMTEMGLMSVAEGAGIEGAGQHYASDCAPHQPDGESHGCQSYQA